MAILGEKRFTFTEIQKFYCIPISCCGDHCYLNVGKNSIVKVHDQKPLHTWTLTHPNYFTCPVVYFDDYLYCVKNNEVLMKWSVNEDNLKNAETVKFQESVFGVIPVTEKQPLVLFNSGNYAVVNDTDLSAMEPQQLTHVAENEEIVWTDASITTGNIKLFFLIYNEKHKTHTLHKFTLHCDDKFAITLSHPNLTNEKISLKSWCLNSYDSSFLTFWSDGMICLHKMKDQETSSLLHLKDFDTTPAAAITYIDATHIAIAFWNMKQKECMLEIWDTKFSVLKARKAFKTHQIQDLQIAAENSNIFLYFNKEVISIPFHLEHSTLAAAVGKSLPVANQTLEFSWGAKGELLQNPVDSEPELMDITDSKQCSADTVEMVAQRLMNQNSQYLTYIPESDLAKFLQLAIRHSRDEKSSEKCSKEAVSVILNVIFSASFNDIFLVKCLKRMNLEETLVALELLLSYLNQTIELSSNIATRPSDLQIVNWTCLIIQSHMEALLLSKDKKSKKLLKKLEKALYVKTEEYEDYEDIQNYFTILQKKDLLPEKCTVGKYCIETLDI